ncbi:hypothetical protein OSB04_024006 [Centaurea solstitialis]|uniref:Uncharacterized protein n=1 Tax=Centaurea solstitialis TaxID=347529 RepID=A0AA38SLZ3_9ASTR|nr:hypothetical protein OSB04_024006 [Centaurea solstitialis]
MNIDQIKIGLPDAPGIFMIDCLIISYESWVIDTRSGNHICNHLQGFTRRETLRKDRSNLRVGEGTPLIAEAVGSYSLSLLSGLVLELEKCYYVPKMIKNLMSFDLLVYQATPVNGLYTVNLQDDNKEIYHTRGEYLSQEFGNHLMERGIVSQLTVYTSDEWFVRKEELYSARHGTIDDVSLYTTSIILGHALETTTHILNRAPTKSVEKTPYELWKGKKPKMSFLKIWGCEVYVKRPTSEKLKPKSDKCFFVGYPKTTVGYYFYNPEENKVFVARNGKFLEEKFLSSGNTKEDVDLQIVDEDNTVPTVEPKIQHENDLRRSTRVRQEPDRYLGFLVSQVGGDLNEPTSYGKLCQAVSLNNGKKP